LASAAVRPDGCPASGAAGHQEASGLALVGAFPEAPGLAVHPVHPGSMPPACYLLALAPAFSDLAARHLVERFAGQASASLEEAPDASSLVAALDFETAAVRLGSSVGRFRLAWERPGLFGPVGHQEAPGGAGLVAGPDCYSDSGPAAGLPEQRSGGVLPGDVQGHHFPGSPPGGAAAAASGHLAGVLLRYLLVQETLPQRLWAKPLYLSPGLFQAPQESSPLSLCRPFVTNCFIGTAVWQFCARCMPEQASGLFTCQVIDCGQR